MARLAVIIPNLYCTTAALHAHIESERVRRVAGLTSQIEIVPVTSQEGIPGEIDFVTGITAIVLLIAAIGKPC